MMISTTSRYRFFKSGLCAFCLVSGVSEAQANPLGGQIPEIPAFLPMSTDVPMTEKLPIDGEWTISTIGKRIRIEGGRAYAIDPWLHMFVLRVQSSMVVLKDIRRTGPRQYSGYDLPMMGNLTANLQPDGSLSVSVQGAIMPVKYNLIPVRVDDPRSFDMEKTGQHPGPGSRPEYGQQPGYPQQPGQPGADAPPVNPDEGQPPVDPW